MLHQPVQPAPSMFPLFRAHFWAATSWTVDTPQPYHSTSAAAADSTHDNRCQPSRQMPKRQELHVRSMDRLDLKHVQQDDQPTEELQARREKFAFFEKHCSQVADRIYLGSDAVARNKEVLQQNGVTHVVNCVGFLCNNYHANVLQYKTLYLQDAPSEDILCILYHVFDFMEAALQQPESRVYVHCSQGVSRSASCVIAYLMWKTDRPYDEVFREVKQARGVTNPNIGFICQLLQWHKRRHTPFTETEVRLYQVAPQSHWAASMLVAKTVKSASLTAFDTRGAFIAHCSDAIYLWKGAQCPPQMFAEAQTLAAQTQKYESPALVVTVVEEGQEPLKLLRKLLAAQQQQAQQDAKKASEGTENQENQDAAADSSADTTSFPVGQTVAAYDSVYKLYMDTLLKGSSGASSQVTDTPRSQPPKTPREDPEGGGSPNQRLRKAARGEEDHTPRLTPRG